MKANSIKLCFSFFCICLFTFSCEKTGENVSPNNRNISKIKSQAKVATPIVYNEGLATVYRGIKIPLLTALTLNIPSGYYRIREFRVLGSPAKKAISLSILNHFGENVNPGLSVLPDSNMPWVFNYFTINFWSPTVREIKATDVNGNILYMKITLNESKNCWVTNATLNNLKVTISTQTFLNEQHNSCAFQEPAWTIF